jgi:PAS domain-containing protein
MPLATHLLRSSPGCCIDMTFDNLSNSPRSGVQDAPWTFDERAAAELERLAQGVIVADEAGRLVFANAAAVAIHGRLIMGGTAGRLQPDARPVYRGRAPISVDRLGVGSRGIVRRNHHRYALAHTPARCIQRRCHGRRHAPDRRPWRANRCHSAISRG